MIQIDKSDFLYKTLLKLGVEQAEIDNKYIEFANCGVASLEDFNSHILAPLEMVGEVELGGEWLEEVLDYYHDLKKVKKVPKSKFTKLLKQYKLEPSTKLQQEVVNAKLQDALLIACSYKMTHPDLNINDLVQTCNLGLLTAIEQYQADSHIGFDTYLNYWILQEINNEFTQGEKNG